MFSTTNPLRQRHLDGYGYHPGQQAAKESRREGYRFIVRVDEGYAIAWLHERLVSRCSDLVQQIVGDLDGPRVEFSCGRGIGEGSYSDATGRLLAGHR